MKAMYALLGISKQAHLGWHKRQQQYQDELLLLLPLLDEWRSLHPCMGLKKLYNRIQPSFMGRDAFIDFCMTHGYQAVRYARAPRTSLPLCSRRIDNLLNQALVTDMDQVWVSDTTYFKVLKTFFYLTFIMDVYSRKIIGYHASDRLFAQANVQALQMAIEHRNKPDFAFKTIHHSDRGAQYNSQLYRQILQKAKIRTSMCNSVYENLHIERVHQTIKGEYLSQYNIQTQAQLNQCLKKAVALYNEQRPHYNLNMTTPLEFECYTFNVPLCQRTPLKLFTSAKSLKFNQTLYLDPAQLALPFK